MGNILQIMAENERQRRGLDDLFYKNPLYVFELIVPGEALANASDGTGLKSFLFPLSLGPNDIRVSEPFTQVATPGGNAGLFVEENGILMRNITIQGNTGFRPREIAFLQNQPRLDNMSYNWRDAGQVEKLSGQKHMQFLQDRVFRLYGELKKHPQWAHNVRMNFHNFKDQEHWRVIPVDFTMQRSATKSTMYMYNIRMYAVEKAEEQSEYLFETDGPGGALGAFHSAAGFVQDLQGAVQTARNTIDQGLAVVQLVNEVANDVRNLNASVMNAVGSIGTAFSVASDTLRNIATVPAAALSSLAGAVDRIDDGIIAISDNIVATGQAYTSGHDTLIHNLRDLGDHAESLITTGNAFSNAQDRSQEDDARSLRLNESESSGFLSGGTNSRTQSPQSLANRSSVDKLSSQGTAARIGDDLRRQTASQRQRPTRRYQSVTPKRVGGGDKLSTLAMRYLGDSSRWSDIARVNNLRPPYISETGGVDVLRYGDVVLIPSEDPPPAALQSLNIVGASRNDPVAEQLFGVDMKVERDEFGQVDFVIDVDNGSTDFELVRGTDNLVQAVTTRVETEKGTVPEFPNLGHDRIIGTGIRDADSSLAKVRIRSAILADPRILDVISTRVSDVTQLDRVDLDIDAVVRGLDKPLPIRTSS